MKRALLFCATLLAILMLASCKDADNPIDDTGNMIPYAAPYQGFTFYPDGYGKLTYVTYYPITFSGTSGGNKAWATNSDGANYGNLTWTFTPPASASSSSTATLQFNYQDGSYEIYPLHNDAPPSGYRGSHYYEYTGYTGGYTYTYDGSWDLDADLNNTHGLIVEWLESSANYTVDFYVNGEKKTTLSGGQCCVVKVPYGTYDIKGVCSDGVTVSEESAFEIGYNKWYYHYWY
jgi:hypothetical protein